MPEGQCEFVDEAGVRCLNLATRTIDVQYEELDPATGSVGKAIVAKQYCDDLHPLPVIRGEGLLGHAP